jgi:hypothetical protein
MDIIGPSIIGQYYVYIVPMISELSEVVPKNIVLSRFTGYYVHRVSVLSPEHNRILWSL